MIFRRLPDLNLTPNLSTLIVDSRHRDQTALARAFMHPNLTSLTFAVPADPVECKTMFDVISHELSDLSSLHLLAESDVPEELLEAGFTRLSSHFPSLHTVSLPYLTTSLVNALSSLASLEFLSMTSYTSHGPLVKEFKVDTQLTFPRLTALHQTSRIKDLMRILSRAPKLEQVRIRTLKNETIKVHQALLANLSNSHPRLTLLDINNIPHAWSFRNVQASEGAEDTFAKLVSSSFAAFTRLTSLLITMPFRIRFTHENIEQLLSSLPVIEELYLNCSHIILRGDGHSTPSTPSIHILSDFAKWCPGLTELGLFVDCRTLPLLTDKPEHTLELTRLNLGVSHIGPYNLHLAHYLSYHRLPDCKFESASDLWPDVIEKRVIAEYGSDYKVNRWDGQRENIERMFHVFVKLQEQTEREKKASIKKAILRGRTVEGKPVKKENGSKKCR